MAKKHISVGKSRWTIVGMCGGGEIYKINQKKKKKKYVSQKFHAKNHPEANL